MGVGVASVGTIPRMTMFRELSVLITLAVAIASISSVTDAQGTDKVFMCYWGSWSYYRVGYARFVAEDIDPTMCTHVIYSFSKLNIVTGRMESTDVFLSNHPDDKPAGEQNMYRRTVALKERNPNLKVLLAVGGASVIPKDFSDMAASKLRRDAFVASVVETLDLFAFDGLDMDWEYPTDEERGGKPEDKENFSILLQELRAAFGTRLLLTAALVVGPESKLDPAYDIPSISRSVDYMLIMAYDYFGYGWNQEHIRHNSPLFMKDWEAPDNHSFTVSGSVEYYLKRGAPPAKLALGVPAYGRTYGLSSRDQHNYYDKPGGSGVIFPFSSNGTVNYFEICYNLLGNSNWEYHFDYGYYTPFAFNNTQWIGYDDEYSIMRKVDYAEEKGLGGMMLWSIEMDDCRNICEGWMRCPISYTVKERMAHHKKIRDSQLNSK